MLREVPARADVWHHLADAHANLAQWPEAAGAAREAARRRPSHAPYARHAALLAAMAERFARLPDDPVMAAVLRADAFRLLGAYEHARRTLDPVITASPQRPEPMTVRIHADIEDRQYATARRTLDDARRRFPALADWAQLGAMLDAREALPR
jgi:tetratricopeptide (TPR) repeat protein